MFQNDHVPLALEQDKVEKKLGYPCTIIASYNKLEVQKKLGTR